MVEEVIAKSPAEKAGIKEHDILLMAGNKPLAQPADLTGLIEAEQRVRTVDQAVARRKAHKCHRQT